MKRVIIILTTFALIISSTGCRPKPTIMPTPTPRTTRAPSAQADLPPRLVGHIPARGAEHPPDAPIILRFDQAMDPETTAAAFSLQPRVPGEVGWRNPATLIFTPTVSLARDTRYRVAVSEKAHSAAGLALVMPAVFHFTTLTPLSVTQVSPAPDTTDVSLDSAIMVVFNRPVVPLSLDALRDQSAFPHPLTFEPSVDGNGEWVNTATFVFHPTGLLQAGATYRVRIPASLTDITGVSLEKDYAWSFSTLSPAVLETSPAHQATNVPPDAVVRITFNQPMKRQVGDFFTLRDAQGNHVPGKSRWIDDTTLVFTPTLLLARETTYVARIDEIPNAGGDKAAPAYEWMFFSLPHFRLVRSDPPVGPVDVSESHEWGYPGQLFLEFSAPVNPEDVLKHLTINPPSDTPPHIWHSRSAGDQVGMAILQPSTAYTLTIDGALTDRYGDPLGQDVVLHLTTLSLPPIVYLNIDHTAGWMRPDELAVVYAAHRNVSQLNLTLRGRGVEDVLACFQQRKPSNPCNPIDLSSLPSFRTWSQPVLPVSMTTAIPVNLADGGPLPPGIYHLTISEPSADQEYTRRCTTSSLVYCAPPRSQTLIVANGHILLRKGLQTFAWATDLRTGEPLAEHIILAPIGDQLHAAVTDSDGIAYLPAETEWAFIIDGETFAVGWTGWRDGTWYWGQPRGWYEPDYYNGFYHSGAPAIYLYTDRPLYRPGDTVFFKGIFRSEDKMARYHRIFPSDLTVTIRDSLDQEVYNRTLPLTAMGTFSDVLALESYAPLGVYTIKTCYPHPYTCYGVPFRVAAYRTPEFEVTVSADKNAYFPGETARMQIEAGYYFGAPVPDAVVEWEWRGPQSVEKGSGRTDADGRLALPRLLDRAGTSCLTVNVRDAAGQMVSGRGCIEVKEADVRLEVATERPFFAAGQTLLARARAVNLEGIPLAGQPITLTLYHWGVDAETIISTAYVTTDANGWSERAFTLPSGGRYRLTATTTDPSARPATAETTVWATGTDPAWPTNQATLISDRDFYAPGDTAYLLISNSWPGMARALLTVERSDVMEHRVFSVPPGGTVIEWPIQPLHAPNVFFAVTLVPSTEAGRPTPGILFGTKEMRVSLIERTLRLELVADPPQAQPSQTVTWTVRATDWQGNPARAELSLALVDKAVLSLTEPNSPTPLDAFYPTRAHAVYAAAGLRFPAAHANLLLPKYYEEPGGMGGGGDGALWGETQVRQRFQGTALWVPAIHTDESGTARVQVTLPDNITTWQMDARAVDADTRVGYGIAQLMVSKPFLVRPVTPRFLVVGDKAELGAVVHNDTDVPLTATVVLSAAGVILGTPPTQTLAVPAGGETSAHWLATVPMGDRADLVFGAFADHPTLGRLADASRPPVGIPPEQHLPVYHYAVPETVGTAGQLAEAGERLEGILLPPDLDVTQGELTLRLDPSLAGAVVDTLWARDDPYYGTPTAEAIASRLLPNLFTYRAIREGSLNAPQLESVLMPLIQEDLFYAQILQHDDGGWGWRRRDPSSPVVSAQMLLALLYAQRLGFDVEQSQIERAIGYLKSQVRAPETLDSPEVNHQAIILHALAEAGEGDEQAMATLAAKRQRLQHYARALLLLAFARTNPRHPTVAVLLSDLTSAAIMSATGAHWEEEHLDYWAMNTDTRTTAIALDALVHLLPESDLVPNVIRWLMVARRADGTWETSQETAWALIALTDWLMKSGELHPDYAWRVLLNSRQLTQGRATPANALEAQVLRVAVADLLRDTANRLLIARGEGPGRLYYTAHLRVFRPVEAVTSINRGVFVAREYTSLEKPGQPITSARVGEIMEAQLTIVAPHDLHYVVIEDPFPAGCEPIDPALRNAANFWQSSPYSRYYESRPWWLDHIEMRDEKTVILETYLPRGTYEIRYKLQATRPGEYRVLPSSARETFFPEVFGHGAGSIFTVWPAE